MNRLQSASLLLLVAFSVRTEAQTSNNNQLTEHSRAIQFQINSNFTLGSFQGAALSYKHHLQPSSALRVGVDLSLNDANTEAAQKTFYSDTLRTSGNSTRDQSSVALQLNTQAIWYSESSLGILFFYGTGPFVGFSRWHQEDESISSTVGFPQSKSTLEGTATTWSLGLTGLLGVEWFASKSISLHAEYGIRLGYAWTKNESSGNTLATRYKTTSEGTTTSWQLSSNAVRFGLSVYFE